VATQIVPAPVRAEDRGLSLADRLAHQAASHVRVTPEVQRAVTRYVVAFARAEELLQIGDVRDWTPAEFRALTDARAVMAESNSLLAAAGQLHLIEVSR
jgi:hypothetical protein